MNCVTSSSSLWRSGSGLGPRLRGGAVLIRLLSTPRACRRFTLLARTRSVWQMEAASGGRASAAPSSAAELASCPPPSSSSVADSEAQSMAGAKSTSAEMAGPAARGGATEARRGAADNEAAAGAAPPSRAAKPPARLPPPPLRARLTWKRILAGTIMGSVIGGGAYVSTRDPATYSDWIFQGATWATPLVRLLPPETAHRFAVTAAKYNLVPREFRADPPSLRVDLWGRRFLNPVGLAAGFDKNAEAIDGFLGMGFGFIEIGSVTPLAQDGNPSPRVFRLPEQKALINSYGFNNEGIVAIARRLGMQRARKKVGNEEDDDDEVEGGGGQAVGGAASGESGGDLHTLRRHGIETGLIGVNLGKNKSTEDAVSDFVQGVHTLSQYADYLVINVSSPNTPGLRSLQGRRHLQELIKSVMAARSEMQWGDEGPPPVLVKLSPDLSRQYMEDIAAVALSLRVDGLIISNTTVSRPASVLGLPNGDRPGGLSGKPLFELSNAALREMYILTKGRIPIVGCGGVSSGEDAYLKIRSGASLVQLYTALVYEGPSVVPKIKQELAACLERDGFKSVAEAVGVDVKLQVQENGGRRGWRSVDAIPGGTNSVRRAEGRKVKANISCESRELEGIRRGGMDMEMNSVNGFDPSLQASKYSQYQKVALEAAKAAGEIIAGAFNEYKRVDYKGAMDLVTETDRQCEEVIFKHIKTCFPDHEFIGEEGSSIKGTAELTDAPTWMVDPLDGTTNFVHRFPFVCVSVALVLNKQTVAGVVYNPILNEIFTAVRGGGAYLNGKRIHVSTQDRLEKALLATEVGTKRDRDTVDETTNRINALLFKVRSLRLSGSCACNLAGVACGRLDMFYEIGFGGPWDVAAGALLVEEAGGKVFDPNGGPFDLMSRRVAASNALLEAEFSNTFASNSSS
ncbi:hypothetical protein CBR_g49488 [Chara braunii]|uniref:Dihydroorotate dehydrogenase (quinone), mitochondrial n=1 Tax=Chara braunii TaxID=69332 RepID=A0A388K509_CHABU|nr:hypothetical protein CBR_g49488 [Chara braunii]|eukprot:GBG65125.1 hypothetical protein CBR_g49488 [Chara braunii]